MDLVYLMKLAFTLFWKEIILVIYFLGHLVIYLFSSKSFCGQTKFEMNLSPSLPKFCFVSSFFPIVNGTMRHSVEEYRERTNRLLNHFRDNVLYIFTNDKGFALLDLNRTNKKFSNIKILKVLPSIYHIPKIKKFKRQYDFIAEKMRLTEQYVVSSEIGANWNSKFFFLEHIIKYAQPTFPLIFWIDIGILKKTDIFQQKLPFIFPYNLRISKIFGYPNHPYLQKLIFVSRLNFAKIKISNNYLDLSSAEYLIAAGFFGGPKNLMIDLIHQYWKIHDLLIAQKQYVLREEFILAVFCIQNKNSVFFINFAKPGICYIWHSFVTFFSKYNICSLPNSVFHFNSNKPTNFSLQEIPFQTWL